jgi:hypothetical protein
MFIMMKVEMSRNGKWVQVKGVARGDVMVQDALRRMGLRWCSRSMHWWGNGRVKDSVVSLVEKFNNARAQEAQSH